MSFRFLRPAPKARRAISPGAPTFKPLRPPRSRALPFGLQWNRAWLGSRGGADVAPGYRPGDFPMDGPFNDRRSPVGFGVWPLQVIQ